MADQMPPLSPQAQVRASILEAMTARLARSSEILRLTEWGEEVIRPLAKDLLENTELQTQVLAKCLKRRQKALQEDFFLEFVRQVTEGTSGVGLRGYFEAKVDEVRKLIAFLGIQTRTVICLVGIAFKEHLRNARQPVLVQEGRHVSRLG